MAWFMSVVPGDSGYSKSVSGGQPEGSNPVPSSSKNSPEHEQLHTAFPPLHIDGQPLTKTCLNKNEREALRRLHVHMSIYLLILTHI